MQIKTDYVKYTCETSGEKFLARKEVTSLKVTADPKKITVSQTNFARAIGVTAGRVNQLIQEGVVLRDDKDARGGVYLVQSIRNYDALKNGNGGTNDDDPDYISEKAKHERVKRELSELRLAQNEASVYDARTVEMVMIEMLSNLRAQLLGLPAKLAPVMEGRSKDDIYQTLIAEIEEKLSELSEYEPSLFMQDIAAEVDDENGD
ncbi:hypothetical protein [Selenomonas sp. FOBRC9]|uniref:hypothetical protein n=1 Tax=Selenomonas sp. FOBRC9 TaxID=936573 RepID=UPI0018DB647F|nr:hypothetical protein [Selenomonas sp. FOBRC9]